MTTAPEHGRLDRILAEVKRRPPELNQAVTEVLSSLPSYVVQPGSAVERLRAMVVALEAENAELIKLTASCTCTPYPAGDGPEVDCAVHGAVRAFNEATRENAALADALAELAHEFMPPGPGWQGRASCFGRGVPGNDRCAQLAGHPVHRTPAVVRAELEARP